jgi:hypothetical protein
MALVELYRTTGERKYLDFAVTCGAAWNASGCV